MGKRSDFPRRKHDDYATPYAGVPSLLPHLSDRTRYFEPCVGAGDLVQHLSRHGHQCVGTCDVEQDALTLTPMDMAGAEVIITNPPWTREILHPMIEHFVTLVPTVWLLFDTDWLFTVQAAPIIDQHLNMVVPTPRLKWVPGSKFSAKDNTAWYKFEADTDGAILLPRRAS